MPYRTVWLEKGLEKTASGIVTGCELIASRKELYGDPRFDNVEYILSDYSSAEAIEIAEQDVKIVAFMDGAAAMSNPNCRVAIVSPNNNKIPLANYYTQLSKNSPWQTRVFQTVEQAREWINAGQTVRHWIKR